MSAGWNALDYREKAFLIWIAIAVGGGLATTAGRQLVVTMLGILRGRLSLLLLALVLYVAGVVRLFAWLGVWRPSLTDATAFWFAGPALVMFFNSNAATTDVHYFRAVMQRILWLLLGVEFIVNL